MKNTMPTQEGKGLVRYMSQSQFTTTGSHETEHKQSQEPWTNTAY